MKNPFKVGETYRNNLGEYEVVSINEPNMTIKMEDGRTIETTVKLQARIWKRIKWEQRHKKQVKQAKRKGRRRKSKFKGLRDQDFQSGVKGTSWRARTALGGLMADRLSEKTPYDFQSYAVYGRPESHVVIPDCYDKSDRWKHAKFELDLNAERARYGFYVERKPGTAQRWDWSRLVEALGSDEELQEDVEETMRQMNLQWELYAGEDGERLVGRAAVAEDEGLMWDDADGEATPLTWAAFAEMLQTLDAETWYHLYLVDRMGKEETIEQARRIAELTTDIYRMLLPLYEAATRCNA
ncbi:MAG: hypothetical protein ACP5HM_02590 [Anaerolineae bacterium]